MIWLSRIFFLVFTLLSLSTQLPGKNGIDSLLQRLPVTDGEEKVDVLLKLADQLKFSDQAAAMAYAEEGLQLVESLNLRTWEPKLLLAMGIIRTIEADFPHSIQYYERAIELFRTMEDIRGIGNTRNAMGMTYIGQGEYDKAMEAFEKAILIFEELGDASRQLLIKGNIANLAYKRGDYGEALPIYEELLAHGKRTGAKALIGAHLGNIGRVHYHNGDYPAALKNFYKAVAIMDSLDNKASKVNMFNNIGLLFAELEMYEEASGYFEEGLRLGTLRDQGKIRTNLAELQAKQGRYPEALANIREAITIYDSLGIKSSAILYETIASIQVETGDFDAAAINLERALETSINLEQSHIAGSYHNIKGRLLLARGDTSEAMTQFQRAAAIFNERQEIKGLYLVTKRLATLSEVKGDYKEALRFQKQHEQLSDSLFGQQQSNKLIRIELNRVHQNHLKSQLVQVPDASPSKLKRWGGFLLVGLACMIIVFGTWYIRKNGENKGKLLSELQRAEQENQEMKTNLKQTNLQMTFLSLDLAKKDDFLEKLKTELEEISRGHPASKKVMAMIRRIHSSEASKKDWELFQQAYEQVFPNFFDELQANYPSLTLKQLRHCGLIRLKISIQEVADINAVSLNSVHKARHRLREKFGLTRKEKLEHFLRKY